MQMTANMFSEKERREAEGKVGLGAGVPARKTVWNTFLKEILTGTLQVLSQLNPRDLCLEEVTRIVDRLTRVKRLI
jgi:hypothetical protein